MLSCAIRSPATEPFLAFRASSALCFCRSHLYSARQRHPAGCPSHYRAIRARNPAYRLRGLEVPRHGVAAARAHRSLRAKVFHAAGLPLSNLGAHVRASGFSVFAMATVPISPLWLHRFASVPALSRNTNTCYRRGISTRSPVVAASTVPSSQPGKMKPNPSFEPTAPGGQRLCVLPNVVAPGSAPQLKRWASQGPHRCTATEQSHPLTAAL